MRSEVLRVDNIDAAVEQILSLLKEGSKSRENVIYFDGWDGLGASTVLRSVAQRPVSSLQFDRVVHVDCSKWESRRSLQRLIAEQLELPSDVMDLLNQQDKEDDFNVVAQGPHDEVLQVQEAMYDCIQKLNRRFLVIFHNGSSEEIDLARLCGFPLFGYSKNTVLWTFQGRFRLKPRSKVDTAMTGSTDVFLSATRNNKDPQELWSDLVHQEAADLVAAARLGHQSAQVAECFSYLWKLCGMNHGFRTDYDLAIHCCSYWICDGIIQEGKMEAAADGSWRVAHALREEMRFDADYQLQCLPPHLERCARSMDSWPHWISPTFLCTYTGTLSHFPPEDCINNLSVLKLSHCIFSFSSPPFRCCQNLRFLWLNHCKDDNKEISSINEEGITGECFFQRLWVLDVRYTSCGRILSAEMMNLMSQLRELIVVGAQDWDMGQLQGRLPNIRKLRVKHSTIINCNSSNSSENCDLFPGMMDRMELLEFSGNHIRSGMESLTIDAKNSSLLWTVIIEEGCFGLKHISIWGCPKLKILLLRGTFENLESIDISDTELKTLDLSAVVANKLELVSIDCNKLCAILWPPKGKQYKRPSKLRIITTGGTSGPSSLLVKYGNQAPNMYNWYVCISDARLLRSLVHWEEYIVNEIVHMEVSSPAGLSDIGEERTSAKSSVSSAPVYEGVVTVTMRLQHGSEGNDDSDAPTTITQIWPCPHAPDLGPSKCYMYIQDPPHQLIKSKLLELGEKAAARREEIIGTSSSSITVPEEINVNMVYILHMHDSRSITHAPCSLQGSTWRNLRWCRVERCPSLDCVFFMSAKKYKEPIFYWMRTLWSSQLPRARSIWNFDTPPSVLHLHFGSFEDLQFVHVDLCPRLTYVLPFSTALMHEGYGLHDLGTLELVWCGDLRVVFPIILDNDEAQHQEEATTETMVRFPMLKRIHLHELPMLQGIWGCMNRMYTPELESIKIRGCWSLTRLPAVAVAQMVECDCEKEWWDKLKWDGKTKWENEDVNHDPSFYKPTHPRHYKRRLLRTSALR